MPETDGYKPLISRENNKRGKRVYRQKRISNVIIGEGRKNKLPLSSLTGNMRGFCWRCISGDTALMDVSPHGTTG